MKIYRDDAIAVGQKRKEEIRRKENVKKKE